MDKCKCTKEDSCQNLIKQYADILTNVISNELEAIADGKQWRAKKIIKEYSNRLMRFSYDFSRLPNCGCSSKVILKGEKYQELRKSYSVMCFNVFSQLLDDIASCGKFDYDKIESGFLNILKMYKTEITGGSVMDAKIEVVK